MRRLITFAVVSGLALAACSGSSITGDDYRVLEQQLADAEQRVLSVTADLERLLVDKALAEHRCANPKVAIEAPGRAVVTETVRRAGHSGHGWLASDQTRPSIAAWDSRWFPNHPCGSSFEVTETSLRRVREELSCGSRQPQHRSRQ